jgi:mannose-1-phosphate guanylyltransferase/mannose-1-phosphate guanylyltransferase/mannose-6-phosphate isomerase
MVEQARQEMTITPVLLCGGSGSRLWPLSRKSYPKQFSALLGDQSLFQSSVQRVSGAEFDAPLVVTNSDFRFIVSDQMKAVGIDPGAILIEPRGCNTAPAVLAAALFLAERSPEALMLVAPSDHFVPDAEAFRAAVRSGADAARAGRLVTFGIRPTYAETGYGYLELASAPDMTQLRPEALTRFVEKPDPARANDMVAAGNFLWNSGIFLFSVQAVLDAFGSHAPDLIGPVQGAVTGAVADLGFIRLDPESWRKVRDISIDYAVMERANNLSVVPFGAHWSDLGGWDAVWRESSRDSRGVVTSGAATAIDCDDTMLRSDDADLEIVGIGLKNIVAVALPDAVLVADSSRAQDVKEAVDALKRKQARQATDFPKDHRPWGWFESLALGDRFQVKRITVHPGAALSLQSHHHRAEHWIIVAGTARVTVDDDVRLITENQSVYIPLGARHRLENPGKVPLTLIEVQTGGYLGEDDIIRYEDIYARAQGAKG